MKREMQLDDLALSLKMPVPSGAVRISQHVNRLRSRPIVERRLAEYFGLTRPELRHRLWPAIFRRPRARVLNNQESK